MSRRAFGLTAGAGWSAVAWGAAADAPGAIYSVNSKQRRARATEVSDIGGFLGRRLNANAAYLEKFDVGQFVEMLERKNYRDWFWLGEQPGKWLEAAVHASASCGNAALADKARRVAGRMLAAQEDGGYLGVTDPAIRTRRHPMRGMDPYELYFTLHALLSFADQWEDAPARQAAMRLGDFFLAKVKPDAAEFWPLPKPITIAGHEVHYGLEGTLLLDPMMRLYEVTGERRYLDWCRWVMGNIDKWTVVETFSNLGKVAAGTMQLQEIQPKVHAHTLNMNMLGFLRLYETTGDTELLRRVLGAWRSVMDNQRYITGGVSVGESYREPHLLYNTGQGVETCSSMSWLLLNQHLLELTGNLEHADAMEILIWNHLLAAQTWDADGYRYFCPLNGWKPAGYYTGPNCCSSSGPRIMAFLPGFFYGASADSLFVNQYVPSRVSLRMSGHSIGLRVSGDYPTGPDVVVEIASLESPQTFALNLRIPAWCANPALRVNGTPHDATPGTMVGLRREWKRGDRVEISLPMETKWVEGNYTNQGLAALTRGPLVCALDTVWTQPKGLAAGADSMRQVLTYMKDGARATEADPFMGVSRTVRPAETPQGAVGPAYAAEVTLLSGQRMDALMLPFANLGRWYGSEAEKQALIPSVGTSRETSGTGNSGDTGGYRQGSELGLKIHPYAVWVKPV
jgi:hypothetical protein